MSQGAGGALGLGGLAAGGNQIGPTDEAFPDPFLD